MSLRLLPVAPVPRRVSELLQGRRFIYSTDFSIPAESSVDFLIKTNGTDCFIQSAEVTSFGAETLVQGFAEVTTSALGSEVTPVNHNRQSSRTPSTKLYSGPTVADTGTEVTRGVAYAASQPGKVILASSSGFGEFLLGKKSENLFRITNRDANNATSVSVSVEFVEVEA